MTDISSYGGCCYDLNVCVPQIHMLTPSPQQGGVRRWDFGEVMRSGGYSPPEWISALIKKPRSAPSPLPPQDSQEVRSVNREVLTRH